MPAALRHTRVPMPHAQVRAKRAALLRKARSREGSALAAAELGAAHARGMQHCTSLHTELSEQKLCQFVRSAEMRQTLVRFQVRSA